MKKTLKIISILIVLIGLLSLYGYIVRHVALGGEKAGIITTPVEYVSTFPKTVYDVLTSNEIKGIPLTYLEKDSTFEAVNNLNYDLYGLNSFYNIKKNRWDIKLFNFKNDSIVYEWYLLKDSFKEDKRKFENARPMHSIMLPDRQLIANGNLSNNLYKIDKNSNVIWHNTSKFFHHSLTLDNDGNIWACTSENRKFKLQNRRKKGIYEDDFITKIDNETGEILYDKSVSDLLIENGYKNYVYGFANFIDPNSAETDPLHLNDIQPVLKDGPYWKKGDLFLSLRHRSLIIHYRPETNKIIHMINGPFLFQHDVDIISDHEIALFNNNTTTIGNFDYDVEEVKTENNKWDEMLYSEILVYNYNDSTFTTVFENAFKEEEIYTRTEGLYEFLSSGDVYVENHNDGELYIFNKHGEVLLKKQFATSVENLVHMPTWVKIYENIQF